MNNCELTSVSDNSTGCYRQHIQENILLILQYKFYYTQSNGLYLFQVDPPSNHTTQILETISNILATPEHSTLMECSALDTLYSVLFSTVDIIPQYHVTSQGQRLRADHFKLLVDCLTLAGRFSIHVVSKTCLG